MLTYTAKADVGGKLAQLGSRLIDGTAKKMADEFFNNFSKQVAAPAGTGRGSRDGAIGAARKPAAEQFVWASAAIVILMILVLLFR